MSAHLISTEIEKRAREWVNTNRDRVALSAALVVFFLTSTAEAPARTGFDDMVTLGCSIAVLAGIAVLAFGANRWAKQQERIERQKVDADYKGRLENAPITDVHRAKAWLKVAVTPKLMVAYPGDPEKVKAYCIEAEDLIESGKIRNVPELDGWFWQRHRPAYEYHTTPTTRAEVDEVAKKLRTRMVEIEIDSLMRDQKLARATQVLANALRTHSHSSYDSEPEFTGKLPARGGKRLVTKEIASRVVDR